MAETTQKSPNAAKTLAWVLGGLFVFVIIVLAAVLLLSVLGNVLGIKTSTNEIDKISVTSEGVVRADPDYAQLSIGVVTESATVDQAQNDNNSRIEAIKAALKALGVEDKDISTSRFNIYPTSTNVPCAMPMDVRSSEEGSNSTEVIYPYTPPENCLGGLSRVEQYLEVKVREIAKTGSAIDAATGAGATNIESVYFMLDENHEKELSREARAKAVQEADRKAKEIADAGHVNLGKTHLISENVYYTPYFYAEAKGGDATPSTVIEPGQLDVRVSIQAEYEIR